jgi:two-component system OmpR family response regulator
MTLVESPEAGGEALDAALIAAFRPYCTDRRALVLEDDPALGGAICESLHAAGFKAADLVTNGLDAVERAAPGAYDLLILDRNTPGIDGREALMRIRAAEAAHTDAPRAAAMFLTALGVDRQRIEGLVAGADDYLVKPVSPMELLARAAALLRRTGWSPAKDPNEIPALIENGPLVLRPPSLEAVLGGAAVKLTGREYAILALLAANLGLPVTRSMIWDRCWPEYNFLPEEFENRIDVHAARLRKRLETAIDAASAASGAPVVAASARPLITSIRSQGLMLRDLRGSS